MQCIITIDRFENDKAILKTEDGDTSIWPKNKLPKNLKEGDIIRFTISDNNETSNDKKELAKNILNEILNTESD